MVEMNLPLPHLLKHLISGRWMMAVVSFYILLCAGATYIFGIYSGTIKEELHYDQETLNTLSFFKDIGANVGIIAGIMNEILPAWIVLLVGACMNTFGYLMVWLAVTHRIARPPTWQMNLFLCAGANSQTFTNTGVMVTFVKNFPQGRGEVLGIIKGFAGLSGALFTQVYLAVYGKDARGLILLIALLPSLVTFMFMFFIRLLMPVYDTHEKRNFYSFLYLAMLIAVFLLLAIMVENQVDPPPWAYKAFGSVTVMLVVSNVVIGMRAESTYMKQVQGLEPATEDVMSRELSNTTELHNSGIRSTLEEEGSSSLSSVVNSRLSHTQENHDDRLHEQVMDLATVNAERSSESTDQPPLAVGEPGLKNTEPSSSKPQLMTKLKLFFSNWPEIGDDFTIPQALLSLDLWTLLLSIACGLGSTITAIDNMGQIGESLGYSEQNVSTFVSLISIWNFFGRVAAGFGSEILLRHYRCPRTLILTLVIAITCIGHILIAFPATNTLYIASIIQGFCFGAQVSLYFTILSELFGLKYYATLQSVGGVTSPLGTYLLNVKVAGYLYDRAAQRQHAHMPGYMHGNLKCMGYECFRLSFSIMTVVTGFGSLVSSLLTFRTRKFYNQDIYSKFHVKQDNNKSQSENKH